MRLRALLAGSIFGLLGCTQVLGLSDYEFSSGGNGTGGLAAGGGGGDGGGGGSDPETCLLPASEKTTIDIEGEITQDQTLGCEFNYKLNGNVFVNAPATLTIEAGTTIFGDKTTLSALIIGAGARVEAVGTPDMPIVLTSFGMEFSDAGDWGGFVVLGNAPINQPTPAQVEGLLDQGEYGGDDPDDSSGTISYVRIEYSGKEIAPNNELNGLTLAGVGKGTQIDHVMVRRTTDDCFEFFGGTVDATHLICQEPGDDAFDFDNGYTGRLQFLVVQQALGQSGEGETEINGFESDNDAAGDAAVPRTSPTIYNATLCGRDYVTGEQYGALLRKQTAFSVRNAIFIGFEAGVDLRDMIDEPSLAIQSSTFFDNGRLAYPELAADPAPYDDDDFAFDEVLWLNAAASENGTMDPGIPGCDDAEVLALAPRAAITSDAATPPDDGFFDPSASYQGAFRDTADTWATGAWVRWADE